jgi:iron complex outermembrane receptor protein
MKKARIAVYVLLLAGPVLETATAQNRDTVTKASAVQLDPVVTIGTRRLDRTATHSPVPVDVISEATMQSTGLVETWQALQRIVPSLNVPHYPLGDNNMRSITLRGLAPDQVLVLVNGKRRHSTTVLEGGPVLNGSTPVDINMIPTNAIEHIEVLRDGAAAQYGSDAIAGVVNVVLKSGEQRQTRATFGQAYTSEGGRDFRDGRIVNLSATYGATNNSGAQITMSAEFRDRGRTNRAYPDSLPQYLPGDPRNNTPPRVSSHQGNAAARQIAMFVNTAFPFRGSAEMYAFGGMMHRGGSGSSFFRRANDVRTVRALHPDGFLPETRSEVVDISGLMGLRGSMRQWRWDLSSVWGGNSVRSSVHNSNNVTLGAAGPTDFYAGKKKSAQWTSNLDFTRRLDIGSTRTLNIALGTEFRLDHYLLREGEPDSYRDGGVRILDGPSAGRLGAIGAIGNVGNRPIDVVDASRSNVALYTDLDGYITPRLLVDVAGRAERYSDFGSTTDGKIAARFELFRGVGVRAAAGTGFRAPSLTQAYSSSTAGVVRVVNGVSTVRVSRTLPVNSPEAKVLGAKPLRAEKSLNSSGGIVFDVAQWPTITADYYAIDVDDRIVLSGLFDDPAVALLFEAQGLRGIVGGRYFTNAIDTRTRGFDIVASHGLFLGGAGLVRLTGAYNRTRTRVTRVSPTPPQLSAFQSVLFGRVERGKIETGQPDKTITIGVNYSIQRLAVNLHNQRFGKASLLDASNPDLDQTVRPKWITDFGISYQLQRRVHATASVSNLFDVYPDQWRDFDLGVNGALSMNGVFRYPGGISPFGMDGRMIYVHLSYR